MSKSDKLLNKARNNPDGLSFADFQSLMKRCQWQLDHQRGSHQIWYSPHGYRLSVQNRHGKAKGYQVKQFFLQLDKEVNNGKA